MWLFNIFDAYRQATLINYGYLPDQMPAKPQVPSWGSGGLTLGVAVFLLGFYFFLHNRFDFDLSLIFDNADILVMAFGAFLIGRWILERKKAADIGREVRQSGGDLSTAHGGAPLTYSPASLARETWNSSGNPSKGLCS